MAGVTRSGQVWLAVAMVAVGVALGGCGGGSEDAVLPTGTVRLVLTDVPDSDITEMHVHITRVAIWNRAEATRVLLDDGDLPDDIELIGLSDSPMLLGEFDIRAGRYSEIRVLLSDEPGANWVRLGDGSVRELELAAIDPEGGTRLIGFFHLEAGSTMTLLVDFNAAASIYPLLPGEPWGLRPMIFARALPGANPALGGIRGTVTEQNGDPLVAPEGSILGVFARNQDHELVAVAEVCCDDGSFAMPRLVPGNHYLTVRFTTPTWDLTQTSDPLTILTPGHGPEFFVSRVRAGATSTPNLIIDL